MRRGDAAKISASVVREVYNPPISILVPCHNEADSIVELYRRVVAVCQTTVGDSFELVFVNDGSHIDAAQHVGLLSQLCRLLAPQGSTYVFEHNLLTTWAANNCEFDANAVLIRAQQFAARFRRAGFSQAEIRYRIFFPHALRSLRRLESYLMSLPFGAQYCIVGR